MVLSGLKVWGFREVPSGVPSGVYRVLQCAIFGMTDWAAGLGTLSVW